MKNGGICLTTNVLMLFTGGYKSEDFLSEKGGFRLRGTDYIFTRPMLPCYINWNEYYQNSKADFLVTIDDDLEILSPNLLDQMLRIMKMLDLKVFSSDKTVTGEKFDTYSQGEIVAMERNDTWLCIYDLRHGRVKNESMAVLDRFVSDKGETYEWRNSFPWGSWRGYESHFRNEKGKRYVWDEAAYLQQKIREECKQRVYCISDFGESYKKQSVHYAHFSNNSNVNTPFKTWLFRMLVLSEMRHDNKYIKKILHKVKKFLFNRGNQHRMIDRISSKLD